MGNYISIQQDSSNTNLSSDLATSLTSNPQQNLFHFENLTFDSTFESGNLMYVDKISEDLYHLWIAPDCYQTQYETKNRVWFYFKVTGPPLPEEVSSRQITFRLVNMNKLEQKNYKEGMVPVYSSPRNNHAWDYIPTPLTDFQTGNSRNIEIEFQYNFNSLEIQQGVFFAFTFPYTHSDCLEFMATLEKNYNQHPSIYLQRDILTYSLKGLRIDSLVLTKNHKVPQILLNHTLNKSLLFGNKRYIIVAARVHAAESPANFMLQGLINSLLNLDDPVSQILLENFVFVVVPMLNPDGVYNGHYRMDIKGRDLNRSYIRYEEDPEDHPSTYALMEIARYLSESGKLAMFLDFHAHSNQNSGFLIGRFTKNLDIRREMRLFARVMDIYSKNFDFNSCKYTTEKESLEEGRQGVASICVQEKTNILHSYTFESGYHMTEKDQDRYCEEKNMLRDLGVKKMTRMGIKDFEEMGECVRHAICEVLLGQHPDSMVNKTWFGSVEDLRSQIANDLLKEQEEKGN